MFCYHHVNPKAIAVQNIHINITLAITFKRVYIYMYYCDSYHISLSDSMINKF